MESKSKKYLIISSQVPLLLPLLPFHSSGICGIWHWHLSCLPTRLFVLTPKLRKVLTCRQLLFVFLVRLCLRSISLSFTPRLHTTFWIIIFNWKDMIITNFLVSFCLHPFSFTLRDISLCPPSHYVLWCYFLDVTSLLQVLSLAHSLDLLPFRSSGIWQHFSISPILQSCIFSDVSNWCSLPFVSALRFFSFPGVYLQVAVRLTLSLLSLLSLKIFRNAVHICTFVSFLAFSLFNWSDSSRLESLFFMPLFIFCFFADV